MKRLRLFTVGALQVKLLKKKVCSALLQHRCNCVESFRLTLGGGGRPDIVDVHDVRCVWGGVDGDILIRRFCGPGVAEVQRAVPAF